MAGSIMLPGKNCGQCKEYKPLKEFYKWSYSKDGLSRLCISCDRARQDEWKEKNRERWLASKKAYYYKTREVNKARAKIWRKANPDKIRISNLKWSVNTTLEEYQAFFDSQGGRCFGCQKHNSELAKNLSVDHNHKTGKKRGLLCNSCNRGLGLLKDSVEILKRLTKYLEADSE